MPVDLRPEEGGGERSGEKDGTPLAIIGQEFDVAFIPKFSPETIRPRRQRNLNRSNNFCKGEDVTDNGSKNYEVHLTGRLVGPEKDDFWTIIDSENTLDMTSATWSGEVRSKEGEIEGPVGWNPQTGYYHFTYTLDVVSTGAEFRDSSSGNGIISEGNSGETTFPLSGI